MFRWSWKVATFAEIDVYVHGTFFLLLLYLAATSLFAGEGIASMVRSVLLVIAVFASVVLHEFGHALTARSFGARTRDITLLPIGGIARLESMPEKPIEQLLVAVAGPLVNVGIALVLFVAVTLLGGIVPFPAMRDVGGSFLSQLFWINVSLAAFNMVPAYPMDGGRVLRALLAMQMPDDRATRIAARLGQGIALVLALVGAFVSPMLIVIALFVWLGAEAEHSRSTVHEGFIGLTVRDAMITEFESLAPSDSLASVIEHARTRFQRDFPVIDGGRVVGVLTYGDLVAGASSHGVDAPVERAMRVSTETARVDEPLELVFGRMSQSDARLVTVVEGDRVIGVVTSALVGDSIFLSGTHRRIAPDRAASRDW